MIKKTLKYSSFIFLFLVTTDVYSQNEKKLNLPEIIDLGLKFHPQIKLSTTSTYIAHKQIEVSKTQRIPVLNLTASASYLGDVFTLDKNFGNKYDIDIPNFGNSFGAQASQLLFKGGLINKSIEIADIKYQLSLLDLEKEKQNIKFILISNTLDLQKIDNQLNVMKNNKILAQKRLANIENFYKQNMVTKNELIRSELTIKNIDQSILTLSNNRDILNYQLVNVLGLPEGTKIIIGDSLKLPNEEKSFEEYLALAYNSNPQIKLAQTSKLLAHKTIGLTKSDYYPSIIAFSGYNMQRPLMNSFPAKDIYLNSWQAGLSLNFSIDNLYKTRERIKVTELLEDQSEDALVLINQNINIAVNGAFIKFKEAIQQLNINAESKLLAEENYKIIEAKYLNQLALQTEMIDAQNQKIQTEIDYENALINVIFQYYNLIKITGTL